MSISKPHQLAESNTAETTVESPVRSRAIRAAADEVRHLHQLERVGQSEWTPWLALGGLILFLVAIALLMFGIVEAASYLLTGGWAT